jgi:hypothetical protein
VTSPLDREREALADSLSMLADVLHEERRPASASVARRAAELLGAPATHADTPKPSGSHPEETASLRVPGAVSGQATGEPAFCAHAKGHWFTYRGADGVQRDGRQCSDCSEILADCAHHRTFRIDDMRRQCITCRVVLP